MLELPFEKVAGCPPKMKQCGSSNDSRRRLRTKADVYLTDPIGPDTLITAVAATAHAQVADKFYPGN